MSKEEYSILLEKWGELLLKLPLITLVSVVVTFIVYFLYIYPIVLYSIIGLLLVIFVPPFIYGSIKSLFKKFKSIKRNER